MKKIYIAHDFNLNLKNFKLPIKDFRNIIKDINKEIIIYDIDKTSLKKKNRIDIYWGNRINLKILAQLENLKWIHFGSSGVNSEILNSLKLKNILVTNSKGIFDNAVSQTTLSYILYIYRGLHAAQDIRKANKFDRIEYQKKINILKDLDKCKILVCGYGSISKQFIKYLSIFNSNIYVISNQKNIKNNKIQKIYSYQNIDQIAPFCDILVNILPLNDFTNNFFNKKLFNLFKKNSTFINIGRGNTVNKKDLITALERKKIRYYCSDVFNSEDYVDPYRPLNKKSSILSLKNSILTPHVSGYEHSYWDKQINIFNENLRVYLKLNNKNFVNKV